MRKTWLLFAALFALQLQAQSPLVLQVWPNGPVERAPFKAPEHQGEWGVVFNVDNARLYVYQPDSATNTGTAVVICPGGGYGCLAMGHEGHDYAKWLAKNGITGIVLKYRLPNGHRNIPQTDAFEAMRIVRRNATQWGIDPQKVGISGFSAGGHLASTVGTHFDAETRPDFMILFYPVITFQKANTHWGSRENLLGEAVNDEKWVDYFSNERHVTAQTPPTLLLLSDVDTAVPTVNSVDFYSRLKEFNIPASLVIFPGGYHGWGLREDFPYAQAWRQLFLQWLQEMQLIPLS